MLEPPVSFIIETTLAFSRGDFGDFGENEFDQVALHVPPGFGDIAINVLFNFPCLGHVLLSLANLWKHFAGDAFDVAIERISFEPLFSKAQSSIV